MGVLSPKSLADASCPYDARHLNLWDLDLILRRWRASSGSWRTIRLGTSM